MCQPGTADLSRQEDPLGSPRPIVPFPLKWGHCDLRLYTPETPARQKGLVRLAFVRSEEFMIAEHLQTFPSVSSKVTCLWIHQAVSETHQNPVIISLMTISRAPDTAIQIAAERD